MKTRSVPSTSVTDEILLRHGQGEPKLGGDLLDGQTVAPVQNEGGPYFGSELLRGATECLEALIGEGLQLRVRIGGRVELSQKRRSGPTCVRTSSATRGCGSSGCTHRPQKDGLHP
jgi:hypothetical protein